jgi:hypothetical protein
MALERKGFPQLACHARAFRENESDLAVGRDELPAFAYEIDLTRDVAIAAYTRDLKRNFK